MTLSLVTKGLIGGKALINQILCPEISVTLIDELDMTITIDEIFDISVEIQGDFII